MNKNVPVPFLGEEQRQRWLLTRLRAGVPAPRKTAGIHRGRVAVRASGSFRVGNVDGINARHCRLAHRERTAMSMRGPSRSTDVFFSPSCPAKKERLLPPHL